MAGRLSDGSCRVIAGVVALLFLFSFVDVTEGGRAPQAPALSFKADSAVKSVALSSSGEYAVAGSALGKVYLFSRSASAPLWTYSAGSPVGGVVISSDGGLLVAGTDDGRVLLFNRSSSSPLWAAQVNGTVTALAMSADGTTLAAGTYFGALALYAASSPGPLWNTTLGGAVQSLALPAAGGSLAAGTNDGKVYLFGRATAVPQWNLTTVSAISSVAISGGGAYIAAGGGDGRVYLLSSTGGGLWNYSAGGSVNAVAVSYDGNFIAAGTSMTNRIYLFSRTSSTPLWSASGGSVWSVALSSDGAYIAAGSFDSYIYLYGKDGPVPLWKFSAGDTVGTVSISADGSLIAGGADSGWFYLLNRTVPNALPALSAGTVAPPQGSNTTLFTYRVTYSDADDEPPEFMRVLVDGASYTMTKVDAADIVYSDGVLYEFRTTLGEGGHGYRFEASDGKGLVRLPESGNYTGPQVLAGPVNTPPSLASGKVGPVQGGTTTRFTFSVIYTDSDDTPPAYISTFIDGENRTMKKVVPDDIVFTDGAEYRYETALNTTAHSFYFEASDGQTGARFPSTGSIAGPNVSATPKNNPPVLGANSIGPAGGNTSTLFTFTVVYTDVDDQNPAVKDLILDGKSYSMSLSAGTPSGGATYTYQTALGAGVHRYSYSFSDGYDGVRLPSSDNYTTPNITSAPSDEPLPVAVLKAGPLKVKAGGKVALDGRSSGGNITAYYFDFGDGTASDWVANGKVEHVYPKGGRFTPKLKVRDVLGRESVFQVGDEVVVEGEPQAPAANPVLYAVLAFLAVAGGGALVYFLFYSFLRLPARERPERERPKGKK